MMIWDRNEFSEDEIAKSLGLDPLSSNFELIGHVH